MAEKIQIVNADGSSVGEFEVDDASLEFEKGQQAVHEIVVSYLANRRASTASTKNRSAVKGGGQKPFRQKGLGRARAGSPRSPVWVGGGVVFGPTPGRRVKKMNKKVARLALKRAFSERVREGSIKAIDSLQLPDHKTKNIQKIFDNLSVSGTVLIGVKDYDENLLRATGNIPGLTLMKERSVNAYHMLRSKHVLFAKDALEDFVGRLATKKEKVALKEG